MEPHLVFQLVLPDVQEVRRVEVNRLHEAEETRFCYLDRKLRWTEVDRHSQLIEEIWVQDGWQWRGRRGFWGGRSSTGMLGQHVLEADVSLGAAVHTVSDAHGHRHRPPRSSAGPPPQYVGQQGVPDVQGGVPRKTGQLLPSHLEETNRK